MGSAALATKSNRSIARPVKTLIPLIQREIAAGDDAGLEHYVEAGAMLLEAREQVAPYKWSGWLTKNFELSHRQANRYMKLAERAERGVAFAEGATLAGAIGEKKSDAARKTGTWKPIREFTAHVDVDRVGQERQARADETRLHRELALELIDIGYKALATRLHPDFRDGSAAAMRRLNRVRAELKAVAKTRRYE